VKGVEDYWCVISWSPPGGKRKTCCPRTDWTQAVKQNITRGGFGWSDLSEFTADRRQWKELTLTLKERSCYKNVASNIPE